MEHLYPLKRRRRRNFTRLLLLLLGIVTVYFTFNYFIRVPSSDLTKITFMAYNQSKAKEKSLSGVVNGALEGSKGTYGVVVKNLKTNETFFKDEHKSFEAGSLYKLWIMASVMKKIQAEELKEDTVLSQSIETLNDKFDIDPDLAEQTGGEITLSVNDALRQMITISHNYAALLLTEQVKLSSVASFLKKNEFNESTVGTDGSDPKSTPYDIAQFFEKLYKGDLANEQYTKEMIDLLKNQQLNDKLPKYLPQDVDIAHKTGEIDFATHDAGIIYDPTGDYIIVVLSNSDSPPGAEERIAEVSKVVYNYFTKN